MATIHENDVYIHVYDKKGNPLDVSRWTVTIPSVPGNNYPKGQNDTHRSQPFVFEQAGNTLGLRYYVGRHASTHVAANYMDAAHGTVLGGEWPEKGAVITPHHEKRSANMSVKGDFEAPHKLNFFFPVSLKTPGGFVIDLLLAQSGSGDGLLQKLKDVVGTTVDFVSAAVDFAEEDDLNGVKDTMAFVNDLRSLVGHNLNPWYVTVQGSRGWPAMLIPGRKGRKSVLFVGPVGSAKIPGKVQACRFYYDKNEKLTHPSYTFNLKVYDERPFRPDLQPK